jgi:hypothetical protein
MLNAARQLNDSKSDLLLILPYLYSGLCMMWENPHEVVYRNPNYKPKDNTRDSDIYCVPGLGDQRSAFIPLIGGMLNRNYGLSERIQFIHVIKPKNRDLGFECSAQELKKHADPNKNNIWIGHSCGGLETAHFVENLAKEAGIPVTLAILISSPLFGAPAAKRPALFCRSKALHQIKDDSYFLKNLREQIRNSETEYFYISAAWDRMVPPGGCCIPEHLHRLKKLPNDTHLTELYSCEVADLLQDLSNCAAELLDLRSRITSICSQPEPKNKSTWCSLYRPAITVGLGGAVGLATGLVEAGLAAAAVGFVASTISEKFITKCARR